MSDAEFRALLLTVSTAEAAIIAMLQSGAHSSGQVTALVRSLLALARDPAVALRLAMALARWGIIPMRSVLLAVSETGLVAGATSTADATGAGTSTGLGLSLLTAIATAAAEVGAVFGLGLLLPASKMGKLELGPSKNPMDPYHGLMDAFAKHHRDRDEYRRMNPRPWSGLTSLVNGASGLLADIVKFLRKHPDHPKADDMLKKQNQVEEWIAQYVNGGFPEPPAPAASEPVPVKPPPEPVVKPGGHPHTVSPPPTLEEMEGARLRERIARLRERIRQLRKDLAGSKAWETEFRRVLEELLRDALAELEELRKKCQAIGQSTAEEWDKPIEDPGGPPLPDRTETWLVPYATYVNRRTGEMGRFTSDPDPEEWEPVKWNYATGQSNIRWGWLWAPRAGEPGRWVKGWVIE